MNTAIEYDNHRYSSLTPQHWGYYLLFVLSIALTLLGLFAAYTVEHAGHKITGMNNHVVWGLPHVFAISLIVAASGALNGASMSSVFKVSLYKPFARHSVVLALSLLVGGLSVLVLDLGRPDRLIVAMTSYNFRSIFAWNIFLYTGFLLIGIVYLWMMLERRMNRYVPGLGALAFIWRIVLTTGTGCIFGFLVGRNALDSALMAPLFIALSLVMGTAFLAIALITVARWQNTDLDTQALQSLEKLMLWFLLALVYFSVVHHLTNLYVAEHQAVERYTLSGPMASLFWFGHIGVGVLFPVSLLLIKFVNSIVARLWLISLAAIAGGMILLYVIVIGSQSTPQRLFPAHTVLSSRFGDAGFAPYTASIWEWGLGIGGFAFAVVVWMTVLRILPFTPQKTSRSHTGG